MGRAVQQCEAKASSKLQHPNTVRLLDFGQTRDGMLFIAMEFLDGMPLSSAIQRGGRMQPARVLKILIQCCQSLSEAHGFGIIHRDIKPDNLFLVTLGGQPDFVKVLDFSVAKLKQQAGSVMQTQAGIVFGTPNYMSPEQGRGLPLDARSDIYALGIVAYEMLMGRPPFMSQNPMEVLAMHVRTPVPPLQGVPDRVAQIVLKALGKEPAQRQQSVDQLAQECQSALAELSGGVPVMAGVGPAPGGPPPGRGYGSGQMQAHQNMDPGRTMVPGAMQAPGGQGFPPPPQTIPSHTPAGSPQTILDDGRGGAAPAKPQSTRRKAPPQAEGASGAFWAICIVMGIVVGVLAYFLIGRNLH